jgi:hypothetical protein
LKSARSKSELTYFKGNKVNQSKFDYLRKKSGEKLRSRSYQGHTSRISSSELSNPITYPLFNESPRQRQFSNP